MAIPWSGFPMAKLVELAKPLSSAKYVRMETFLDKSIAPGQKQAWYPVALCRGPDDGGGDQRTRLPGHRRLRQADRQAARRAAAAGGAVEVRLQVDQVDRARSPSPTSGRRAIWEALQASEYGFWANVNPEVPHPRWSQATEEVIGTGERRPTLLFNGYGEYVADIYKGLEERAAVGVRC